MRINKYIYGLAAAVLLLCTSCNDMENSPSNKFTDNSFWTSAEKAQYVVNMAYSQMYNAGWMWTDESLSDNVIDGRGMSDQRLIRRGMATPSINVFADQWKDMYGGIKTCHVFLEKVDLIPGMDAAVKARMSAEIRFIRAFLYFRLTNLYGAVPFFTRDITLNEANTIGRTPHETIMAFIHNELEDIKELLPSRDQLPDSERGKITRGAVCALQARAYLMDSDWDNVIKYCGYLMNNPKEYGSYKLFGSYRGLFEEANEYNQEVILDRAYVPGTLTWGEMGDMAPITLGARLCNRAPQQSLVDTYLMLSGKRIDEDGTDYNSSYPYDKRDPRLTATIVYDGYEWSKNVSDGSKNKVIHIKPNTGEDAYIGPGQNTTATGYYTRKYYAPQKPGDMNSGINLIMFRYADILLMYAEAKLEKQEMTQSVWNSTIKEIRKRAGFTEPAALDYPSNKSEIEMRQIIRNERRCELALEGLRWYDIKRWKAGTEYLDGYAYGATFDGKRIQLDNRRFDENRDYLWAIPQSQINLNPNLAPNNPGYAN